MKILFLKGHETPNGCVYHRIEIPMHYLSGSHEIAATTVLDGISDEVLSGFDFVYFNGTNGVADVIKQVQRLKDMGIPFVFDIDDYWVLPTHHLLSKYYKEIQADLLIHLMRNASVVTTTHDRLAERIKPYNNNVIVAPNCIAADEAQWQTAKVEHDGMVFGWAGSVHHVRDVELIYPAIRKSFGYDKLYYLLGGYQDNKVFTYFENLFSNWGKNSRYIRIESANVYSYAQVYDLLDVCLIPLEDNTFNAMKSNLKMLEAGFKKKAVIVSNVHPYKDLITDKNCISCSTTAEWRSAIKKLYNNPNLISDLGEQLYNDVQKYEIKSNNPRNELFDKWQKITKQATA